jgi:hypothetical protein
MEAFERPSSMTTPEPAAKPSQVAQFVFQDVLSCGAPPPTVCRIFSKERVVDFRPPQRTPHRDPYPSRLEDTRPCSKATSCIPKHGKP